MNDLEDLKEPKNSYGIPLSRVTKVNKNIEYKKLLNALRELGKKDLPNLIEDVTAQINKQQRGKIISNTAAKKSIENNFSAENHRSVVYFIENMWKWAAEQGIYKDKNENDNVKIVRYVSAININNVDAFAWITVKRSLEGNRIYSIELLNEKKLRSKDQAVNSELFPYSAPRSFEEIIVRLNKPVNELHRNNQEIDRQIKELVPNGIYQGEVTIEADKVIQKLPKNEAVIHNKQYLLNKMPDLKTGDKVLIRYKGGQVFNVTRLKDKFLEKDRGHSR